ncbi:hypothetical protein SISNIDRAFT_467283 [Sistotremastrum niveocremeum HHB9708]|uniref:DUF6535 domain-containing protein n=1 Tax=Sistotremastrum niveocremeum HHB9708 TaxID=1314777 RepID=A0A164T3T9_9AGAM|nr:hypothetical protein SISNIDRAFT_467283 [Sistotremastrum niveocremeum HHB9708]
MTKRKGYSTIRRNHSGPEQGDGPPGFPVRSKRNIGFTTVAEETVSYSIVDRKKANRDAPSAFTSLGSKQGYINSSIDRLGLRIPGDEQPEHCGGKFVIILQIFGLTEFMKAAYYSHANRIAERRKNFKLKLARAKAAASSAESEHEDKWLASTLSTLATLAMADTEHPKTPLTVPAAANGDLGSKFDTMIGLMQQQNQIMADQGKTLKDHSTMLETLKTDALKKDGDERALDDQAMEGRSLKDRLTWNVLRKEANVETKEKVDEWKDLMQLSLVFAFTSVTTSSSSQSLSKPTLPPLSTQFVALFFYLALIVSILNAVLCVLGMQWASRLLATPVGKDDLERTLAHEKRRALAEGKLLPLMGVLFWTLLLSIGFFIVGLLIQLWALSFSCNKPSFVLIFGAAYATALSMIILGVILATTYHAAITKNSPFESPLSAALRPALQWFKLSDQNKCVEREFAEGLKEKTVDQLVRAEEQDTDTVKALKTYARLVLNTTDAEVLERAVPSFEIGEWYSVRDTLWDVFLAVRERFLATDTSFRVKDTVHKQLVYFVEWGGWRRDRGLWKENLEGNAITEWCRDQCKDRVQKFPEYRRQFFPAWVFFTSLDPDNSDLRGLMSDSIFGSESYEHCVGRVLSSFDRTRELGDPIDAREDVFWWAVWTCGYLLKDGRSDVITLIVDMGGRSSILRSLVPSQHELMDWDFINEVVAFIIRGNEVAVLEEMAEFFSTLLDIKPVGGELRVIEFLGSLQSCPYPQSFPPLSLNDSALTVALQRDRAKFYLEPHRGLVALPPPSPEELRNLLDDLQSYQHNRASEDLEKNFINAVIECDYLSREGRQAEIKVFLSQFDRVPLLRLVLQNPHFSGQRISSLIRVIIEPNELECIGAAPAMLANIPPIARSDGDLPVLAFLAALIPFLPPDYIVPPDFNLSQTITLFMQNDLNKQTWRKNSDTLMHYLDRGAIETSSDVNSVRRFLNLCRDPYDDVFAWWSRDHRTGDHTRDRALELLAQLDASREGLAQPASEADLVMDTANIPAPVETETVDHKESPPHQNWPVFGRWIGELWRGKRRAREPSQTQSATPIYARLNFEAWLKLLESEDWYYGEDS